MKNRLCFLLCVFLMICLFGCDETNTTYTLLPMKQTDGVVDIQIIDRFLTDNEDYANYAAIKKNIPDILSYLVDVTPNSLKEKCSIYRFRYSAGSILSGNTFLIYDNVVYPLGVSFGGYGITEFAYINHDGQDILYFIYSWGSGIHRSHIGAFHFDTKQIMDYTEQSETFQNQGIAFCLSDNGKTLGICRAQIQWINNDSIDITIDKGERLCDDISTFNFTAIDAGST